MRIVFMGTPDFAVPVLESLVDKYGSIDRGVVGIVTVPDRKRGRGQKVSFSAVKQKANELGFEEGINILQPDSLKDDDFEKALSEMEADIFCVVAFRILPEKIFSLPKIASFNIHGSLLPSYRGAAPINRAVMAGDSKTGLTTFILKKKVDTGDMIDTQEVQITLDMTAGELHDKLMSLAGDIAISTIDKLYSGNYKPLLQDESLASPAPKIFREDMEIDFSKNAVDIHNHIRGLSPYPAAWTTMDSKSMKVLKSSLVTSKEDNDDEKGIVLNLNEGEYLIEDNRFIVGTGGDGVIELLEIQLEGKKPTMVNQFIRGYRGEKRGYLL